MRQTFLDADWYGKSMDLIKKFPEENEPIKYNPSLEEINNFRKNRKPILFKTKEEHSVIRALKI